MPEIIIKYKNEKALDALKDFAKAFDFILVKPKIKKKGNPHRDTDSLPIIFAQKPNVTALAGIWKDKDISLGDLREKAWGNRL